MKRIAFALSGILLVASCYANDKAIAKDLPMSSLKVGDSGSYDELSTKPNPDGPVLVYIPSLAALLQRATELKGRPLSEAEQQRISSGASVVAMPDEVASSVIGTRNGVE